MSTAICLTCARYGEVEVHHVAGWRNDPDLTVIVCVACHRLLTALQYGAGINLEAGPRTELDVARATLVGAAHLLELFLARHPGFSRIAPEAVRVAGRLVSAGLDLTADVNRDGRTTPDARRRIPTGIHAACWDPAQAVADWARFIAELDRILNAGALEVAARAITDQLHPATGADFAMLVGVLAITFGAASKRAREVSSGLGEEDAALAFLVGFTSLKLWARLQKAQKGLV